MFIFPHCTNRHHPPDSRWYRKTGQYHTHLRRKRKMTPGQKQKRTELESSRFKADPAAVGNIIDVLAAGLGLLRFPPPARSEYRHFPRGLLQRF